MTFRGKNSFRGLQEAVNALLCDDDEGNDDIIPDLVIIPPELDQLTDTEEFDEDNLDDNMMPTDVPGHIELDIVEDMIDCSKSTASASAAVIDSTLDGPSTSAAASRQNSISEKYLSIGNKLAIAFYYRIALKGKKWWWVIFTYLLDLTMTNAWKFYISLNNKNNKFNTQLQFRRAIVRKYLIEGKSRVSRKRRAPSSSVERNTHGHIPQKNDSQLRCVVCHQRTIWSCAMCRKTLCIKRDCFAQYHT